MSSIEEKKFCFALSAITLIWIIRKGKQGEGVEYFQKYSKMGGE